MIDAVVSTAAGYAISHSHAMRSTRTGPRTLCAMAPSEFLKLLMAAHGLNQKTLAARLGRPTDQPTIGKFLRGEVSDPRAHWAKKAPKELGFNPLALADPDVARQEASRLGLRGLAAAPVAAARQAQAGIDPGMLALQIADVMRRCSPSQRKTAAALFAGAAEDPDEAPQIASALRALLSKRDGTNG